MILLLLIAALIRTVFKVFEANNKVISLFALVPFEEIQALQRNCEDYKAKYIESREAVVVNNEENRLDKSNNRVELNNEESFVNNNNQSQIDLKKQSIGIPKTERPLIEKRNTQKGSRPPLATPGASGVNAGLAASNGAAANKQSIAKSAAQSRLNSKPGSNLMAAGESSQNQSMLDNLNKSGLPLNINASQNGQAYLDVSHDRPLGMTVSQQMPNPDYQRQMRNLQILK